MIVAGSNLAKQKQDQQNNNYKAKAAAPIVAAFGRQGEAVPSTGVSGRERLNEIQSERQAPLDRAELLVEKLDPRALSDQLCQRKRVPVRQAYAAVRFGLADLVRLRSAVDPVARGRQRDPDEANRVVGAG
jgi:hypothetical protein